MSVSAPVRVRFKMDRDTWSKVVTFEEDMTVDAENSEHFLVEYETEHDFTAAINRFQGLIPYERLAPEVVAS
ncbi:hypothetical protein D3C71_78800 [compost metagenome]